MIRAALKQRVPYFAPAVILTIISVWSTYAAIFGFSLFLVLFLVHASSSIREKFLRESAMEKVAIVLIGTMVLFIPALFLTLFFAAGIIVIGSYFIMVLLFMISQKVYSFFVHSSRVQQFSWAALFLYGILGFLIILRNNFTLDSLVSDTTPRLALLVGFLVTISIISTGVKVLQKRNALQDHHLINRHNLVFLFFIVFFSFVTIAALSEQDGITSLKIVSFTSLWSFLIGIPIVRLVRNWDVRRKPMTIIQKFYWEK